MSVSADGRPPGKKAVPRAHRRALAVYGEPARSSVERDADENLPSVRFVLRDGKPLLNRLAFVHLFHAEVCAADVIIKTEHLLPLQLALNGVEMSLNVVKTAIAIVIQRTRLAKTTQL